MSNSDQIDDIIMKYLFNREEKPGKFRQFSLINDVNMDMILDEIPQIRYD